MKNIITLIFILLTMTLAGCGTTSKSTEVSKTIIDSPSIGTPGDVYINGYHKGALSNNVACYWKNTVRTDIGNTADPLIWSNARAIINTNIGLFIAGSETYNGKTQPVIWNNRVQNYLDTVTGNTNDIIIYNGNILAIGWIEPSTNRYACYWTNGVRIDLPGKNATAWKAAVSGNDLYIAGNYINGNSSKACYWLNGVLYDLPGSNSQAVCIDIHNNNIYFGGRYNSSKACYWQNGGIIDVSNQFSYWSIVNAIDVSDTGVYLGGTYIRSNTDSYDRGFTCKNGAVIVSQNIAAVYGVKQTGLDLHSVGGSTYSKNGIITWLDEGSAITQGLYID